MKNKLYPELVKIISETNGLTLSDTLELLLTSELGNKSTDVGKSIHDFHHKLKLFKSSQINIEELINHPFSQALNEFLKNFPLKFKEEHTHLTGAVTAEFIYPRLKKLIDGPHAAIYEKQIKNAYGEKSWPINNPQDVHNLISLQDGEGFTSYLKILFLPQMIFINRETHREAAYHIASEFYFKQNVGHLRLKFSLSRASTSSSEQIPGSADITSEDVILGLYDGFMAFKKERPDFNFILSPSFRKEAHFFDGINYKNKREHFLAQINQLTRILENNPHLKDYLVEVDTVGDEKDLYRKEHFNEMQSGFRKLQYLGFKIRSHHGETWHTLKKGIQAVDNAMNIWHIDTLEHGISLGINPNFYFHRLYQEILKLNQEGTSINDKHPLYRELSELDWGANGSVLKKIIEGTQLDKNEVTLFLKAKFHTAREVEHYQHDVLNRLLQKGVTLVSLPSSNNKLTGKFKDYKDHPFSWWEKKNVQLGVGTDNYVTLNTNFIQELLILLLTDPDHLKITKLLMVATGDDRRPYISHLLWQMRKKVQNVI